ncbi:DUF222 domain-containing protein, partial [Mycobacterium sp. GA-2829]|uniref:DUF222 domain-containing protein n=1 Tax=Mycobacterium sp. GA-2829 TaxID=1772283 RepID=UPI000B124719
MCDGALPEIGDFAALTDAELVAAAARWARAESAAAARKMAAVAELYRRRTALADLDGRDRWVVDREASTISEIAAAQNITESRAMAQLLRGVALAERLPRVAALFAEGRITESLARVVVARTALITDVELMAAVDAELAAQITDWGTLSEKKIKEAIDAIVERHDPGAVRRVKDADKDRGVQFGFDSDAAGYTTLWARMYAPDADAFKQRVFDMAHRLCPDDPRSGEERLNDAFAAVGAGRVLRCECGNANCPGATGDTPAKDVVVHVVATRETLDQARAEADAAKTPQPTESKADEKPTPRKSACAAPPYVFGAGIATTALLAAFLDRATIRTVTHPGDAPPEPQYRPSAALSEFIRCRDLTCRFPYCDVPATRC